MKTQPRQHISNKYNTCTVVTSPVYIGSKLYVNCLNGLQLSGYSFFMSPPMADGHIVFTLSARVHVFVCVCVCMCARPDVCVTIIVSGP